MISKSKQQLKGFDLLSMLLLVGTVVTISGGIISRELEDVNQSMGLNEAQNLAFQLAHGGFQAHVSNSRGPASIGENSASHKPSLGIFQRAGVIGKDPWGQTYHYKLLKSPGEIGSSYVVVWSSGPNKEKETFGENLELDLGETVADIQFRGDDFGYIHSLK